MARQSERHDYAPDSYQPASNALGCPFALALALLVLGTVLMLAALA